MPVTTLDPRTALVVIDLQKDPAGQSSPISPLGEKLPVAANSLDEVNFSPYGYSCSVAFRQLESP